MHAEINGLHLFYEERGDPGAETIVFLHGFPLDHRMWRRQLDRFARTFRCIAPDLRGHGATREALAPPQPGQVSIAGMADDVAALEHQRDNLPLDLGRLEVGHAVDGFENGGHQVQLGKAGSRVRQAVRVGVSAIEDLKARTSRRSVAGELDGRSLHECQRVPFKVNSKSVDQDWRGTGGKPAAKKARRTHHLVCPSLVLSPMLFVCLVI